MPYVITTTPRPTHDQLVARIDGVELPCTRIAVATLDEARQEAHDIVRDRYWDTDADADNTAAPAYDLPESGGTIGPLPDGTVIEVKYVDWVTFGRDVRERLGYQGGGWKDIAAFNAEAHAC